ncbi:hypothetical protein AYI68_g2059 [Smittium mucronatum]|uniref:Uncharacterized protein n=1 Tax=Smittium mucronatum TaxID=133383 RepID=A0A1R0H3U3_9FUNG|nr:hypothetical protein AYI68_g2059 [Smittium mucronatum]
MALPDPASNMNIDSLTARKKVLLPSASCSVDNPYMEASDEDLRAVVNNWRELAEMGFRKRSSSGNINLK